MTVVVAIANEKGGVGKSTTAVNIAEGLSLKLQHNRKIPGSVLLIDLDLQMNELMSIAYGEHSAGSGASISELLVSDKPPSPQRLLRRARHHPIPTIILFQATTPRKKRHLIAYGCCVGPTFAWQ